MQATAYALAVASGAAEAEAGERCCLATEDADGAAVVSLTPPPGEPSPPSGAAAAAAVRVAFTRAFFPTPGEAEAGGLSSSAVGRLRDAVLLPAAQRALGGLNVAVVVCGQQGARLRPSATGPRPTLSAHTAQRSLTRTPAALSPPISQARAFCSATAAETAAAGWPGRPRLRSSPALAGPPPAPPPGRSPQPFCWPAAPRRVRRHMRRARFESAPEGREGGGRARG